MSALAAAAKPAVDFEDVAARLGLRPVQVERTVELLDAGNTVPFITRYRKDQTGGLDEEQIRAVQDRVVKRRLLAERKQTILRSIESQGKLTPELAAEIEAAENTKRLEDLYLPFKPSKQTLATVARQRGLELLAEQILAGDAACADLDARAADFVNPDREVRTAADALLGAGHILAERFSQRADVRGRLREILQKTGKLTSTGAEEPETAEPDPPVAAQVAAEPAPVQAASAEPTTAEPASPPPAVPETAAENVTEAAPEATATTESAPTGEAKPNENAPAEVQSAEGASVEANTNEAQSTAAQPTESLPAEATSTEANTAEAKPSAVKPAQPAAKKRKKKKAGPKDRKNQAKAFRDYFAFSEAISKTPPHRVLAINRGERAKVLTVRVEADFEAMRRVTEEMLAPADHPHVDFLRGCAIDALNRLILPSLERDVRRDLTDRAETHAVEVFARNLRSLLLQPPVANRRLLAVDPGFRSGCKLASLDEFGNLLDHAVIHLVGGAERRKQAGEKVVEMVRAHGLTVVVIGNGTACRETEEFVAGLIAEPLKDDGVSYVIVNEAGASVYSTSPLGREEFPNYDATLRGAISIGRRLQDPLSELVKIDAANIGVGMYQHDVKAKHLRESLDAVVESCVNYVGVDLNTSSPALLRYVSGLNQLTARRLYEHRTQHGPFKSREQLRGVAGVGEATFIQAAGFLRISGGEQPLDATWIHPESYGVVRQVLAKLDCSEADLADKERAAELGRRAQAAGAAELSIDLEAGKHLLEDILTQIARPGRDPREELPRPIFKQGILKIDDLAPGMELTGTVLNVVDFGAFVDVGLKDTGLVHVSQLADKFVEDPHQVVSVGDIVRVWVLGVDQERRRVSLSMIDPSKPRPKPPPRRVRSEQGAGAAKSAEGGRPARRRRRGNEKSAGGGRKSKGARPPARKPAPRRPLPPITKKMIEGKEPLRTFGDLKQLFDIKEKPASDETGD